MVVTLIVSYHETFFVPVFIGLLTSLKAMSKSLTPKLLLLFAKNSLILKLRQTLMRGSTQLLVLSHRPWRQRLRALKVQAIGLLSQMIERYLRCALWLRTTIALIVLALTASSSYVFIALLIIPDALLQWVRTQFINTLNKLGITHLLNTVWRFIVPPPLQRKWSVYRKWTLGRQQVRATRRMHKHLAEVPAGFRSSYSSSDQHND